MPCTEKQTTIINTIYLAICYVGRYICTMFVHAMKYCNLYLLSSIYLKTNSCIGFTCWNGNKTIYIPCTAQLDPIYNLKSYTPLLRLCICTGTL